MIDKFSIIMPTEKERVPLLMVTLAEYVKFGLPNDIEFIIPSRTLNVDDIKFPNVNIRIIPYQYEGNYFNPSMALNIGVNCATYENVIITCPEVKPYTNVLEQLSTHIRGNYVCQVWDLTSNGSRRISLVNTHFRGVSPSMYFLAVFKKEDLQTINGWDEDFMEGYAFEDDEFGDRFLRNGLQFKVKDGIVGEHQYHKRAEDREGQNINRKLWLNNNKRRLLKPKNGLDKLENEVCRE